MTVAIHVLSFSPSSCSRTSKHNHLQSIITNASSSVLCGTHFIKSQVAVFQEDKLYQPTTRGPLVGHFPDDRWFNQILVVDGRQASHRHFHFCCTYFCSLSLLHHTERLHSIVQVFLPHDKLTATAAAVLLLCLMFWAVLYFRFPLPGKYLHSRVPESAQNLRVPHFPSVGNFSDEIRWNIESSECTRNSLWLFLVPSGSILVSVPLRSLASLWSKEFA